MKWKNIPCLVMEYYAMSHTWFVMDQQWFVDFEHGFN